MWMSWAVIKGFRIAPKSTLTRARRNRATTLTSLPWLQMRQRVAASMPRLAKMCERLRGGCNRCEGVHVGDYVAAA